MKTDLLREWISLMIEKIRTKKGEKSVFGDKFNLNKFKTLDSIHIMLEYADKFLSVMGQGSSRKAYLLSGKYVLKVALNEKGISQNQAELDVFTNPQSQSVVAKVYSYDPKFQWLISDLVKPITNVDEFEQLSGIDWRSFCDMVNNGIYNKNVKPKDPSFVKAVVNTALKNNMLRGDIVQQDHSRAPNEDVLGHWGKTPDGRLVLLDYGFTHEVWAAHYDTQKAAGGGATAGRTAKPDLSRTQTKTDAKTLKKLPPKYATGGTLVSPYARTEPAKDVQGSKTRTAEPDKKPDPKNAQKTKR